MSQQFKVVGSSLGIIKGVHKQFIRPDVIAASDSDIDRTFERTRGFTQISANTISRCNLTNLSINASTEAKVSGVDRAKWGDDRSHGIIIVDGTSDGVLNRYMLSFFVTGKAIYNGQVDPTATLQLNSCIKVQLTKGGLKQAQTDIIQRMVTSNNEMVVPNRIKDRLHATHHADGHTLTMTEGASPSNQRSVMGDSSNLLADDSLAATLKSLDGSARALGTRSSTLNQTEEGSMELICDGAQNYVNEMENEDNNLISFILGNGNGTTKYMSIQLDRLQTILGHFDFNIIETDAGDMDFTQTDKMNTIGGAIAQSICNQVIGLMIRRSLTSLRFYATNSNGRIEMVVSDRWLIPILTKDIQGLDRDAYLNQLYQTESTIRSEIESVLLPKLMAHGETEMIVDISLVTTASVKLSLMGRKTKYSIQTATSSAWTSINASETQMTTNGLAHKNILRAILNNVASQSGNHLSN